MVVWCSWWKQSSYDGPGAENIRAAKLASKNRAEEEDGFRGGRLPD